VDGKDDSGVCSRGQTNGGRGPLVVTILFSGAPLFRFHFAGWLVKARLRIRKVDERNR
jgi:hypothetical protein